METSKNVKAAVKAALNPNAGAVAELRQFARASAAATVAAVKASRTLVLAAIHAGIQFPDSVETLYAEIRKDVGGIAKAIGAERNKAGDAFVIPNSIMAQVSQVLKAVKLGVDLGTADEPRGLGEIRTATREAQEAAEMTAEAAAVSLMTGDDALKVSLLKALAEAIEYVKAAEGATLAAMRDATLAYSRAMVLIVEPKAEAKPQTTTEESAADAIAQAAEAPRPVAVKVRKARKAA